jgi:transposase
VTGRISKIGDAGVRTVFYEAANVAGTTDQVRSHLLKRRYFQQTARS